MTTFSDATTQLLLNPTDGNCYQLNDAFCPLISVGTVITPDYVYANIQVNVHPSAMRFVLTETRDWKPLFSKSFPNPGLESIQPPTLEYRPTNADNVAELRGAMEREIKQNFDKWRPHGIPTWNFHASKTLRDLLLLLEEGGLSSEEHELKSLTDSYRMCGFPLRMPYESMDGIMEAMKATNVHVNFNPGVEFALAVHIHAYTKNILSVCACVTLFAVCYAGIRFFLANISVSA